METVNNLRGVANLLFLSNNGSQSPPALGARLRRLGFDVEDREVVTALLLVQERLQALGGPFSLFVIGSGELPSFLKAAGHRLGPPREAEFLIVGVDPVFTYAKLAKGLEALRHGAQLLAVSLDPVYPTEYGLRPGGGALVGAFQGMGYAPAYVCGKPDPWAIRRALDLRGLEPGPHCLFVGDHLEVDVVGAQRVGADAALVLSGVSPQSAIGARGIVPTHVLRTLKELAAIVGEESASDLVQSQLLE